MRFTRLWTTDIFTATWGRQGQITDARAHRRPGIDSNYSARLNSAAGDQYQLVACECAQALHGVPYTSAM